MPQLTLPTTLGAVRQAMNLNGLPKNNFAALSGPTTGDNSGAGYEVGSRWINISTNQKWTLTAINGTVATWMPDVSAASGGSYDDSELRGLISGNAAATSALAVRVDTTETSVAALNSLTGQHTTQISNLTSRVVALEAGGGSGGTIPSDVPRTQSNPTTAAPAAPWVNSVLMRFGGTDLPIPVGFQSALDVRAFGTITMQELTTAAPELTSAQLAANTAALRAAEDWAFANGGFVQLPGGMIDIEGAITYRAGVGFGGNGEHHTAVRQRLIPRSAADITAGLRYTDVFVAHPTLGAGFNTFRDMIIHGGWESLKEYEGSTGGVWEFDLATTEQKGLAFGTLGSSVGTIGDGPGPSKFWPNGGSDSQNRLDHLLIVRCKGYGLHAVGRGEMMVNALWTQRCGRNGMFTDMADSWYSNITCSTSGDSAIKFGSGASNARGALFKGWYAGCYKSSEVIGAGLELEADGAQNIYLDSMTTQDTWGPGIVARANKGVTIRGHIDEAGGGRLLGSGLGYTGTRTLPRCDIRLPGPFRRSLIDVTRTGGARQGAGNHPYLIDMSGSGIEHSTIIIRGTATETQGGTTTTLDTASGSVATGGTKANGVLMSSGYTNAKRHNEVTFNGKLVHGKRTLTELADATHGINDPLYGPDECVTEFGAPAFRKATEVGGGWEVQPITVTQAQYNALTTDQQSRGNFVITA
ncbi:hypothetical protein GL279_00400 [Paracoccus limosus]|uniref:Uncharacterized protein n=1 Tax=Paracoccus limosus TaxID=913252 RepID=A0A844H3X0_9RHOB|nr:hypothetical protein [Paracoccus limosus]MTH33058.1 hypothetical protein [Paracoccus limosus]